MVTVRLGEVGLTVFTVLPMASAPVALNAPVTARPVEETVAMVELLTETKTFPFPLPQVWPITRSGVPVVPVFES